MADIKILLKAIALFSVLLFHCPEGKAQKHADAVLNNLTNMDNEKAVTSGCENCMFILITERVCEGCFKDMCKYAYAQHIESIYAVDFMSKDLMKMLSRYSRFTESVMCADDVFFLWTDKVKDGFITEVTGQPSPQLILIKDGKKTYLNYSETIRIAK